ncbi:hypothetical protein BDW62DRAFT_182764 [Aspergillus aurantiobrunneus]
MVRRRSRRRGSRRLRRRLRRRGRSRKTPLTGGNSHEIIVVVPVVVIGSGSPNAESTSATCITGLAVTKASELGGLDNAGICWCTDVDEAEASKGQERRDMHVQ